jgi:lysophospholipase L1-like esterase
MTERSKPPLSRALRIALGIGGGSLFVGNLVLMVKEIYTPLSSFFFYFFLWTIFALLMEVCFHALKSAKKTRKDLRIMTGSIFIALFLGELVLRFGVGTYSTYSERTGFFNYTSPYRVPSGKYPKGNRQNYFVHPPDAHKHWRFREFRYDLQTNTLGLREKDFGKEKPDSVCRIFCLGDSFTEGVGAAKDSTWPVLAERHLNELARTVRFELLNAGTHGSDPFYEFRLVKEVLAEYAPDLVIFLWNSSDFADVMVRGGWERFAEKGKLKYRKGPWWEPLYAMSFYVRYWAHGTGGFDYFLRNKTQSREMDDKAGEALGLLMKEIKEWSDNEGIPVLVFRHSLKEEFGITGGYPHKMDSLLIESSLDFAGALDEKMKLKTNQARLSPTDLYWKHDGHFTPKGYQILGEVIASELEARSVCSKTVLSRE